MAADTIRLEAQRGNLPARKVGREWRFSKKAILDWLAGRDPSEIDLREEVIVDLTAALYEALDRTRKAKEGG